MVAHLEHKFSIDTPITPNKKSHNIMDQTRMVRGISAYEVLKWRNNLRITGSNSDAAASNLPVDIFHADEQKKTKWQAKEKNGWNSIYQVTNDK